ncbi:hypothetical protein Golob_010933, partial [Gossypium lobatum]|nr:hypothetical protein [Gossypium lobatum]
AVKKVRRREEDPPNGRGGKASVEPWASKYFSFKDAVTNPAGTNHLSGNDWEEEDFELDDGDIPRETVDGMLAIDFSDRFYSLVQ